MNFDEIKALVGHMRYIKPDNARFLFDLIVEHRLTNILELGIAYGTATCYMAAALEEIGEGSVTAVDLIEAHGWFSPTAEEQLEQTGLSRFARVVRMQTGYNWFLHDEILRHTEASVCRPVYDLCIIDGPKNWTVDGAAFFMADKLLKRGGWMIFDDYKWTYAKADTRKDVTDGIAHRSLSNAELETPHIREVFELLVRQHPDYGNCRVLNKGEWAIAQKVHT